MFQFQEKNTSRIEQLESKCDNLEKKNEELQNEIIKLQKTVKILNTRMDEKDGKSEELTMVGSIECVTDNVFQGNIIPTIPSQIYVEVKAFLTHYKILLWHIPEMRRRIRDAKIGRITSIYSPPFYIGRNGYKMCIRAYLNGDDDGEGTCLSVFFVLMRGKYDPLFQWPFEHKVSLILVDQDQRSIWCRNSPSI